MISCDWIPEKYPPSGTMGAAGFLKLLGRPRLDPLTVLVRETAQNSWDARSLANGPVLFSIATKTLHEDELTALRVNVFQASGRAAATGLETVLGNPSVKAMYVSDRNTVGLGGPVLASRAEATGVYDWVDFVLNVGKANTQGHTGGTYGFGKTIAYVVSSANSIIVYSRAFYAGEIVSRLMACAIGEEFADDGDLYTGRHWWGVRDGDSPTPVTSVEADELATALGMPMFSGNELGTTVMIVEPDFGGRSPDQGMTFIAEAVLWNLWPKLVERGGLAPMEVELSLDGRPVELVSPEHRPPLGGFVQAFRELVEIDNDGDEPPGYLHQVISRRRPTMVLGDLATVPMVYQPRVLPDDGFDPSDADSPLPAGYTFPDGCHHVALLRSPELVVEYLEGPPSPENAMEWAGVFVARSELDSIFAQAEPPTHDTWQPDLISDRTNKLNVKKALQEIRSALEQRWGNSGAAAQSPLTSTAVVAERLAHLVGMSAGAGPGREPRQSGAGGHPAARPKIELLASGPCLEDGQIRTRAAFRITPQKGTARTDFNVRVGAALDGNILDTSVDPSLKLFRAEVGDEVIALDSDAATIILSGAEAIEVQLYVSRSNSTSVLFDVTVEPGSVE